MDRISTAKNAMNRLPEGLDSALDTAPHQLARDECWQAIADVRETEQLPDIFAGIKAGVDKALGGLDSGNDHQ